MHDVARRATMRTAVALIGTAATFVAVSDARAAGECRLGDLTLSIELAGAVGWDPIDVLELPAAAWATVRAYRSEGILDADLVALERPLAGDDDVYAIRRATDSSVAWDVFDRLGYLVAVGGREDGGPWTWQALPVGPIEGAYPSGWSPVGPGERPPWADGGDPSVATILGRRIYAFELGRSVRLTTATGGVLARGVRTADGWRWSDTPCR
jgi:hypothetical protein